MLRSLLVFVIVFVAFAATAQPDTLSGRAGNGKDSLSEMPSPVKRITRNQWGIRTTFRVGQSYDNTITLIEGTYLIRKQHELTAGMMVNFVGNNARSPLLGYHISYAAYPFGKARSVRLFAYFSHDIGWFGREGNTRFERKAPDSTTIYIAGTIKRREVVATNTLGIGALFRAGDHLYFTLATGLSVVYRYRSWEYRFTEPTTELPPQSRTWKDTRAGMEINAGIGWRF